MFATGSPHLLLHVLVISLLLSCGVPRSSVGVREARPMVQRHLRGHRRRRPVAGSAIAAVGGGGCRLAVGRDVIFVVDDCLRTLPLPGTLLQDTGLLLQ